MAAEPTKQIRFSFGREGIELNATTPDLGEAQGFIAIAAEYEGEEMTIAFNSNYITDAIRAIKSEIIHIGFTSPSAPATITDPNDTDFISVLMPMKI